nr:carbohydrate ABC transporter permease [uncultured Blautia sp.]
MGENELTDLLLPVMKEGSKEYASWKLLPQYPTLKHYVEILLDSPEFFVMFWNSVKLTAGALTGTLLVGMPAAWGFAKFDFSGKNILFTLYIALMMMPFQVMLLGNYLVLDKFGLLDSLSGIILPAAFSTFPVFIMYRFFKGIPTALLEAARLDGAGELRLFFMIAIPLGSPGVISAIVLGFLEYWNLIEQPMAFLKTKKLWPLSLYLPNIGLEQVGSAFAASMVTLAPAILVFLAGQDYLEQGIVSTAVKE